MKLHRLLPLFCAALLSAGTLRAESPKLGCAAEVGLAAEPGNHWVLVSLKALGGAEPPAAWRLYYKAGAADAPGNYSLLTTVQSTADPVTIGHIINDATNAGVDIARVSGRITAVVADPSDPAMAGLSLAGKAAMLMQAKESKGGVVEFQRESLIETNALVAAIAGRAVFVKVPAATGTFELRRYAGGVEGAVIGRATTGAAPEFLPAPQGLTEVPELRPQGHLRVQLRWGAPDSLRQRFLHWNGAIVYRADAQHWENEFGAPPPAVIDRETLLQLRDAGHIVQVNRLPVLPPEVPAVPPGPGQPLFTDDNDSVAQTQTQGAPKFRAGDTYFYWVAETDLFGRPGEPSAAVKVSICDRLAPSPPLGLTVTNERRYIAGKPQDFLRLEWPEQPAAEVRRWYVYVSRDADAPIAEYKLNPDNPNTPSLRIVIPNDGSHAAPNGRIRFDHLPAAGFPLEDLGRTVYYRLRAEDDTLCKVDGLGNLSGLSGPVPGARHDLMGPATVNGDLVTKCWLLGANYTAPPTQPTGTDARPFTAELRAERPAGSRVSWVEFRDITNNHFIGRYLFAPDQTVITAEYQPGKNAPVTFIARFGHPGGIPGDWVPGIADPAPYGVHRWTPKWTPVPGPGCPGFHLPQDPESGEPNPCCAVLNPGPDVASWITYVQFGVNGEKTKYASGRVTAPGMIQACFGALPPQGGEICFYAQGFDAGGNPGPMESLGCINVAPRNGLPVPSVISGAAAAGGATGSGNYQLAWNSPPGAERFDAAFTPPPPNAQRTFIEPDATGTPREWGTLETPRVPTPFGAGAPLFSHSFGLVSGVSYRAKIRSVRGFGDQRDEGAWSQPFTVKWFAPPAAPDVPWPQRDAPGVTGAAVMAWDSTDSQLRVLIGNVPTKILPPTNPNPSEPVEAPPLPVDSLEPFLYHKLPLVAYLRDTTAGAPARILQVTHRVDKIIASASPAGLAISDLSIKLIPAGDNTQIWLRLDQAVLNGHTYQASLVQHDALGEIREMRLTNSSAVPAIAEN